MQPMSHSGITAESQTHRSSVGFGMVCDVCSRLSAVMGAEANSAADVNRVGVVALPTVIGDRVRSMLR